jgi:hypothetical protein
MIPSAGVLISLIIFVVFFHIRRERIPSETKLAEDEAYLKEA